MLDKRREIVPERLTLTAFPKKSADNRPIQVTVHQRVEMPDELKLIVFGGLVAVMAWCMLTVYVVSFSQPRVIIVPVESR